MDLTVSVVTRGPAPAPGTPLRVEVRDTTTQDAAAVVLARVDTTTEDPDVAVPGAPAGLLATVQVEVPDAPATPAADLTVFAHVSTNGGEEVTAGDLLTVQSYPATADTAELQVEVVRIG
mgnify:CR=1 FL=1